MSTNNYDPIRAGIEEIRQSWGWFLALGIALILFGSACIVYAEIATSAAVLVFGWLLLISGAFQLIQSFTTGSWSGLLLFLLSALLRGITGYLLVRYPAIGAGGLTLVLGSFFLVGGLFRAIGSATVRLPQWGWGVLSGVVAFMLGTMVLWQIPDLTPWFIGLAVGVDMIVDGAAVCAFASAIHHVPRVTISQGA